MPRTIYLVDEGTGETIKRIVVEGWSETRITELERKLLAQIGETVVIRDSAFDGE